MNLTLRNFYRLLLFVALIFVNVNLMAQPGGGHPCPKPPCPPPVPITGIEILLAGGVALGVRKLVKNKRTKTPQ